MEIRFSDKSRESEYVQPDELSSQILNFVRKKDKRFESEILFLTYSGSVLSSFKENIKALFVSTYDYISFIEIYDDNPELHVLIKFNKALRTTNMCKFDIFMNLNFQNKTFHPHICCITGKNNLEACMTYLSNLNKLHEVPKYVYFDKWVIDMNANITTLRGKIIFVYTYNNHDCLVDLSKLIIHSNNLRPNNEKFMYIIEPTSANLMKTNIIRAYDNKTWSGDFLYISMINKKLDDWFIKEISLIHSQFLSNNFKSILLKEIPTIVVLCTSMPTEFTLKTLRHSKIFNIESPRKISTNMHMQKELQKACIYKDIEYQVISHDFGMKKIKEIDSSPYTECDFGSFYEHFCATKNEKPYEVIIHEALYEKVMDCMRLQEKIPDDISINVLHYLRTKRQKEKDICQVNIMKEKSNKIHDYNNEPHSDDEFEETPNKKEE